MEFKPSLTVGQWLQISHATRQELIRIFGLKRSLPGAVVENFVLKSDGHSENDLKAITVEKMQEYLGSKEEDFYNLLSSVIRRVEGLEVEMNMEEEPVEEVAVEAEQPKRRGRPKKVV